MNICNLFRTATARRVFIAAAMTMTAWGVSQANAAAQQTAGFRLRGHVPAAVSYSTPLRQLPETQRVSLALALPLRNQSDLATLIHRLYDPQDALYGKFLTPDEFAARYAPTQQDYSAVVRFAQQKGLTIVSTHPNRTLLDVQGTPQQIQQAFQTQLVEYRHPSGRVFYAPAQEPQVPAALAGVIYDVVGLDNLAQWRTHNAVLSQQEYAHIAPFQIGSGPGGALTPSDVKTAYNLTGLPAINGAPLNGSGQTLALFELDGYNASDVASYASAYNLPNMPLQNVLVDGYSGAAGSGSGEVTLDIELMMAIAPAASKILVYEGPNSSAGVVDTYNRIATDNVAKEVSTSWGLAENETSASVRNAENSAFQQMAAQGQSMFAASGDSGAYDDGSTLSVDDPSSQPYVTGVGGTQLFVNSDHTYQRESTWSHGTMTAGAGGGGSSTIWSKPGYQTGVGASTTKRDVPDVSLNADTYTGYSIFYQGQWYIFGGTSCAAPIWAAFTALVNQNRQANGTNIIGFLNPVLYPLAEGAHYGADFHDVNDGSTNLYYAAGNGFDDATGWGSFNGANLLADLTPNATPTLSISNGPNVQVLSRTAYISWATNLAANTTIHYGLSANSLIHTASFSTLSTAHSLEMSGLVRTRVFFTVTSATGSSSVTSAVKNFATY